MHVHLLLDLLQFPHHILVHMQTSRRVQNHHIMPVFLRKGNRFPGDLHRTVVTAHGKDIHFLLPAVDLQLLNGGRPVDITGYQQRFLAFQFQLACDLGRSRGLAGTLQARHHKDGDRFSGLHGNLRGLAAHQGDHLLVDDLDHHLAGI